MNKLLEAQSGPVVGDRLPAVGFDVSLRSLVMYAASTWDFHRYHYDSEYVAALGLPAPFVDGQMLGALLAAQLMRWAGPDGFVRRLKYRLSSRVFVGDRIELSGEVTEIATVAGRQVATCRLNIIKGDGSSVIEGASAVVEIS